MSSPPPGDELVVTLRRAAQGLLGRSSALDVEGALSRVVAAAVRMTSAAAAGVLRVDDGVLRSSHATDATADELGESQRLLGEGPCVTAATDPPPDGVVLAADLAADDAAYWPRFAPHAVAAGYRSMLSVHLTTRASGPRVALALYGVGPDGFDGADRHAIGVFAVHAGTLLHGADEAQHLRRAIGTRDVIGQAKGLLMERFGIDDAKAFGMLVSSSQDTNMKLHDVVDWLIDDARRRRVAPGPDAEPAP